MAAITNAQNLRQYESRFSLIVQKILAFSSSNNFVRDVGRAFCLLSLITVFTHVLLLLTFYLAIYKQKNICWRNHIKLSRTVKPSLSCDWLNIIYNVRLRLIMQYCTMFEGLVNSSKIFLVNPRQRENMPPNFK